LGGFSNHAEMRSVNAAMFACATAEVTLSVLVNTSTYGTAFARQPFHKFEINRLGRQRRVDQREKRCTNSCDA
jgi:hypothetical protein